MRFHPKLSALALTLPLALLAASCSDSGGEPEGPFFLRPEDPDQNDPAFTVQGTPKYLLAGDDLTPATKKFTVRVTAPDNVATIALWLDDADVPISFTRDGADFVATVDATNLALGAHSFTLVHGISPKGFYKADFVKGHALYMIISTDWDFSDVSDKVLTHHEELHAAHPELKITHLIGPYVFTDPAVTPARRAQIVDWAKNMRDTYGDEIGLHIHPWCNFVEAAGLTCLTEPSVSEPAGDPTGYTVKLGAYTRDQWNKMFKKADEIWQSVGFGKATSFRAGAWTLETHVAQALVDSGFVVDSSANNWKLMDEWIGYEIYDFNKTQWASIGDTSQPYYPTEDSIVAGGTGKPLGLLELPDNGCMVDYWSVAEMEGIFDANWKGQALETPTQVSTGFHPAPDQYYSAYEYDRLDEFFTYVDQFLASKMEGPVVYIRMPEATQVW